MQGYRKASATRQRRDKLKICEQICAILNFVRALQVCEAIEYSFRPDGVQHCARRIEVTISARRNNAKMLKPVV